MNENHKRESALENIPFKHSGRLGDIIYALPLIKVMVEKRNCKADLYILSDDFYDLQKSTIYHPGEGVAVSQKLFNFINPLLSNIVYINKVIYCNSNELPSNTIDLDSYKNQKLNLLASGNQIWYRKVFSIPVPFEEKWIIWKDHNVLPLKTKYKIVVSKTNRYYNKSINYNFLDEIENVGFAGLEIEYEDFKKRNNLKNLEYVKTENALDFAKLLMSTDLFIGNQSLGFSIAEGLKIARAVEIFEPLPVVIPIGGTCIEFLRTEQLLKFLSESFSIELQKEYKDSEGGFVDCIFNEKPLKFSRRVKNYWRKLRGKAIK